MFAGSSPLCEASVIERMSEEPDTKEPAFPILPLEYPVLLGSERVLLPLLSALFPLVSSNFQ